MADQFERIVITGDDTSALAALSRIQAGVTQTRNSVNSLGNADTKPLEDKLDNISKRLTELGDRFESTGKRLSIGLTLPLGGLAAAAFKAAMDMHSLEMRLNAIEGSAANASKRMGELRQLARAPGLGITNAINDYSLVASAVGTNRPDGENVKHQIQSWIGTMANSLFQAGRDPHDLDGVMRQMQEMISIGRLQMRHLMVVQQADPFFSQAMKATYGTADVQDIENYAKRKDISATDIFGKILANEKRMVPQADPNDIRNTTVNARQDIMVSLARLGNSLLPLVDRALKTLVPIIEAASKAFDSMPSPMKMLTILVGGILAAIGPTLIAIKSLISAIQFLGGQSSIAAAATKAAGAAKVEGKAAAAVAGAAGTGFFGRLFSRGKGAAANAGAAAAGAEEAATAVKASGTLLSWLSRFGSALLVLGRFAGYVGIAITAVQLLGTVIEWLKNSNPAFKAWTDTADKWLGKFGAVGTFISKMLGVHNDDKPNGNFKDLPKGGAPVVDADVSKYSEDILAAQKAAQTLLRQKRDGDLNEHAKFVDQVHQTLADLNDKDPNILKNGPQIISTYQAAIAEDYRQYVRKLNEAKQKADVDFSSKFAEDELKKRVQIAEEGYKSQQANIEHLADVEKLTAREVVAAKLEAERDFINKKSDLEKMEAQMTAGKTIGELQTKLASENPRNKLEIAQLRRQIVQAEELRDHSVGLLDQNRNQQLAAAGQTASNADDSLSYRDRMGALQIEDQIKQSQLEALAQVEQATIDSINRQEAYRMNSLSTFQAVTLKGALQLEDQRFGIAVQFAQKRFAVEQGLAEAQHASTLDRLNDELSAIDPEDILQRAQKVRQINDTNNAYAKTQSIALERFQEDLDSKRQDSQIAKIHAIQAEQQKLFETMHSQVDSILDKMLSGTRTVFDAMGDVLSGQLKSIGKQFLSNMITAPFESIFYGQNAPAGAEMQGIQQGNGIFGRVGSALGWGTHNNKQISGPDKDTLAQAHAQGEGKMQPVFNVENIGQGKAISRLMSDREILVQIQVDGGGSGGSGGGSLSEVNNVSISGGPSGPGGSSSGGSFNFYSSGGSTGGDTSYSPVGGMSTTNSTTDNAFINVAGGGGSGSGPSNQNFFANILANDSLNSSVLGGASSFDGGQVQVLGPGGSATQAAAPQTIQYVSTSGGGGGDSMSQPTGVQGFLSKIMGGGAHGATSIASGGGSMIDKLLGGFFSRNKNVAALGGSANLTQDDLANLGNVSQNDLSQLAGTNSGPGFGTKAVNGLSKLLGGSGSGGVAGLFGEDSMSDVNWKDGPIGGPVGNIMSGLGTSMALNGVLGSWNTGQVTLKGEVEGIAGGAMVGAKYGGLLGAGIGAAIGGVASLLAGVFGGSDLAHTQKLVQQIYGVNISDRSVLTQIMQIAKQSYGGKISVAVYSPEVQKLVGLYAESTGQKYQNLMYRGPENVNLVSGGGWVGFNPTIGPAGQAYSFQSAAGIGTVNLNQAPGTAIVGGGSGVTQISLDGNATTSFLQGQTVQTLASQPGSRGERHERFVCAELRPR